jgi:hypothetical protein
LFSRRTSDSFQSSFAVLSAYSIVCSKVISRPTSRAAAKGASPSSAARAPRVSWSTRRSCGLGDVSCFPTQRFDGPEQPGRSLRVACGDGEHSKLSEAPDRQLLVGQCLGIPETLTQEFFGLMAPALATPTAPRADGNARKKASPCVSTSTPPSIEQISRTIRLCSARACPYDSAPSSCRSIVEPSTSVKRRVIVPVGRWSRTRGDHAPPVICRLVPPPVRCPTLFP